jgi:hypothetical protein
MLLEERSLFIVINLWNFYEYNKFLIINNERGPNAKFFSTESGGLWSNNLDVRT